MFDKSKTPVIVAVVSAILLVIALVSVTFAIWTGSGILPVDGAEIGFKNPTTKYLLFEIHNDKNQFFYVEYKDKVDGKKGSFVFSDSLQNDYNDTTAEKDFDFLSNIYAVAIGYRGMLGELEALEIPEKINVFSTSSREIFVTKIKMQSPEEFPTLNNLTQVNIPSSVTEIEGVSFSYCAMLAKVNFANRSGVTIGENCFVQCPLLVDFER